MARLHGLTPSGFRLPLMAIVPMRTTKQEFMADFLVQRYISNAPNETTGAWVDEGTITDLKASEADLAVNQVASANPNHTTARRRALRWDTTEEFDTTPGLPRTAKATKQSRDKGDA